MDLLLVDAIVFALDRPSDCGDYERSLDGEVRLRAPCWAALCRLNFPAGIVARWCWFRGSALCVQAFGRGWWSPFSAAPQDGYGKGYGGVERRVRRSSRRYRPEASANSRSRASRDRGRRLPQERDVCAGARAEPRWLRPTQARHAAASMATTSLASGNRRRWFTRTTPS